MNLFDLVGILMTGSDDSAAAPLGDAQAARVRAALAPGEKVESLVRGRVSGGGAGVWVLTDRRVLALDLTQKTKLELPADASAVLSAESGRYGVTLALLHQRKRRAIYAADRGLALAFAAALASRPGGPQWHNGLKPLRADEASSAARSLQTSLARLQAA